MRPLLLHFLLTATRDAESPMIFLVMLVDDLGATGLGSSDSTYY